MQGGNVLGSGIDSTLSLPVLITLGNLPNLKLPLFTFQFSCDLFGLLCKRENPCKSQQYLGYSKCVLIRGCYPLVGANLCTSLLILQFSKCSIPKGPFPLTLSPPPFPILSFSHWDLTLKRWLPSVLLHPLTYALLFILCHPAVVCIILLQLPPPPRHPATLSKGPTLLLNKMTTP